MKGCLVNNSASFAPPCCVDPLRLPREGGGAALTSRYAIARAYFFFSFFFFSLGSSFFLVYLYCWKIVSGSKALHISGEVEGSTTWPAGSAHPWKPCAFPTRPARDTASFAVIGSPLQHLGPRTNLSVPPVGSRQVCVSGRRQTVRLCRGACMCVQGGILAPLITYILQGTCLAGLVGLDVYYGSISGLSQPQQPRSASME